MGSFAINRDNLRSVLRLGLLLAALSTYLVSPDDVVWRFVKDTFHSRLLEHLAFGIAAVLLGVSLLLKIQASILKSLSPAQIAIGCFLQALGIAFLMPLPGFLLLLFGELGITLLLGVRRPRLSEGPQASRTTPWTGALVEHIGLCCAFVSMAAFSIVLVDRVADALFATSALISFLAGFHGAWRARIRQS